jgi:HPt (histidine-containing phosphotransfer) domain-containing protein
MRAARRPAEDHPSDERAAAVSGVVDLIHLRRYTFGDQALEKEILSLFLGQLAVTMTALREAASQQDWKIAAHTLKGSCRAVGAFRLGDLAQEAEYLGYGSGCEARTEAISRLEEAAGDARHFLKKIYGIA